jgi:hypothetical protein
MPQHEVAGVGERLAAWDAQTALDAFAATGVPLLYIQSGADLELADLERLAKLVPNLTLGHDQLLATPAQAVAMIERFLVAPTPA